jgi:peroxiredoxin
MSATFSEAESGHSTMTIAAGQAIPQASFQIKTEDGIATHDSLEYFAAGRSVLFSVPGAFTPTCSAKHLPTFIEHYDALKAAGVDRIACLAVNDAYVMEVWGDQNDTNGKIDMLADPHGELAAALGLLVNMGPRSG